MAGKVDFLSLTIEAIQLPETAYQPAITRETVATALLQKPKRICFTSCHKSALKRDKSGKYAGKFSVPFRESIYPIFNKMTGLELFQSANFNNWWRSLKSGVEVNAIDDWITKMGGLVFLRDTLALSVALGEHQVEEGGRSALGQLENAAKYQQDPKAMALLAGECLRTIKRLPFYSEIDAICAVPPRPGKTFDLPTVLVEFLAHKLKVQDLTSSLKWDGKKPSLKEEKFSEKWAKLEAVGLTAKKVSAKRVLLFDDLYQSGITMQFVAMHLLAAGATRIYGMALVKSRKDSDNQ